jgi:nucleotide-binding universal stress UspA family protein
VPVDGSQGAERAVQYVIASAAWLSNPVEIYLLNVQWKVAAGNVKLFISQETINEHYREQGMAELAGARAILAAAGLAYEYHISIGNPAEAIVQYAREHNMDQVVLSKQADTGIQSWLLGSVVSKVLHLAECPVLVVK